MTAWLDGKKYLTDTEDVQKAVEALTNRSRGGFDVEHCAVAVLPDFGAPTVLLFRGRPGTYKDAPELALKAAGFRLSDS